MNPKKSFARKGGTIALSLVFPFAFVMAEPVMNGQAAGTQAVAASSTFAQQLNATTVQIIFANNERMAIDFYGENIFRLFQDKNDGVMREPQAKPEAHILVDNPRKTLSTLDIDQKGEDIIISTPKVKIYVNKKTELFRIVNAVSGETVAEEKAPADYTEKQVTLSLKEQPQEYFYGGGVQNGRFSHKGEKIEIVNTNNWVDGGVASPAPFYWSTAGYGFMWYTFKPGLYDFGSTEKGTVKLTHDTNYLDVFFMVDKQPTALLNDYYQLTGHPVLLPKFSLYEGHLNAYNRDYWKEVEKGKGILFEDGKYYKESMTDKTGIKESLNGEKNNYQFSARAAIDRYEKHDMPLGWFLPNDGYGAGYGQDSTLDGNIHNLKLFGDYARKKGVEIGLWTQSDLHPKKGIEALLQRDIVKEVGDAGVRVLKTDVAWVGDGYSFGLNGVADVAEIMPYYGNNARPFIISLDGWAGTQRYASVWSGDQTGGKWEYIRFHIPTFIGSGLSGMSNITSDLDGIFGGKQPIVNIREFQWKTFTSMGLNMDGWGTTPKYPFILGEPATSINRWYLKMKSELVPYLYSESHEALTGKPLMRAMFLDDPNPYTYGSATRYQFLCGPNFLVAPIYQETRMDKEGNDIRNGIYLPKGKWIDYFNGNTYEGGRIINEFEAPLWKLPIFVKSGAIIPLVNPNNNVSQIDETNRIFELYPDGVSSYTLYDDDGKTQQYLLGKSTTTTVHSNLQKDKLEVTIDATKGNYDGFVKDKSTELRINLTEQPKKITAKSGGKNVKLVQVSSLDDFNKGNNVWFYDAAPNLNKFATKDSAFSKKIITKNPLLYIKLAKTDVTANDLQVKVTGYQFTSHDPLLKSTGSLSIPTVTFTKPEHLNAAFTLTPKWNKVENADYYEIELNGMLYSTIGSTQFTMEDLQPETSYTLKVRAVNKDGVSDWASITGKTEKNPLENALHGVTAKTTVRNWGGQGVNQMFDFNEKNMWHTDYNNRNATPFDMVINLHAITQIDRLDYLPRQEGSNGRLLKGKVYYGMDGINWKEAGTFTWNNDATTKSFKFKDTPEAGYLKLTVDSSVGGFGSGSEMYVFKVPGSRVSIPGDINNDKKVDENDYTSYMNYNGLRKGDKDFEGYVSNGDINRNGLIDAYDISVVATQLKSGVGSKDIPAVSGNLSVVADKKAYKAGETMRLLVKGDKLVSVNALSFALPYNADKLEFDGIETVNTLQMENLTKDRLHSDGEKVLYPTFVNVGEQKYIEGSQPLFVIKFKVKQNYTYDLKPNSFMLVDKFLRTSQK